MAKFKQKNTKKCVKGKKSFVGLAPGFESRLRYC